MALFAEIDKNNLVLRVILIPDTQEHRGQEFIAEDLNQNGTWIQCSDSGKIGKNYPGIGYSYDEKRIAFVAPIPNDKDYYLDEETCKWKTDKVVDNKI